MIKQGTILKISGIYFYFKKSKKSGADKKLLQMEKT